MKFSDLFLHSKHPYFVRLFTVRPRLGLSILLGVFIFMVVPDVIAQNTITKAILAWNIAASLYLFLALRLMFGASTDKIRYRAKLQDEGQFLILFLVLIAAVSTLAAIVVELATVKEIHGVLRYEHIALSGLTILTSWLFTHVMFALHYAHDFYVSLSQKKSGGLIFPGTDEPDYADFLYFAFIIGTSAQTADISFSSKQMRRTGLAHCVLAFFFNTTLLALTINIASGLF